MYGQPNYYGNQYFPQPMQYRPQPMQQPIQQPTYQPQPIQQPAGIQGKTVDSIDVVKAMEIPLDGSISYFPMTNGEAIITKQLQQDGTSKIVIYKPTEQTDVEKPIYVTTDELNKAIDKIDTTSWKEEFKTLKKQIKELTLDLDELKDRKD